MKGIKIIFSIFLFSAVVFATSCGEEATAQGTEYTSAYICPMHCKGSGSEKAGTCPVCKMDYVANDKLKKDGDKGHEHGDHDGHDHGSHDGHEH